MALSQKQKDIRDKKVEEVESKLSARQALLARVQAQHAVEIARLQDEIDGILTLRDALKDWK